MGFGGGGGAALPNHQHTNIPLTGGPLDFDNVTQASLAAGDITYSDGAALQVLGIGSATETLTVNAGATAPEWAVAGGGSAWEQVFTDTIGANSNVITNTFTGIDQDDYAMFCLQIQCGISDDADILMQFHDSTGAITSGYSTSGIGVTSGAASYVDSQDEDFARLNKFVGHKCYIVTVFITMGNSNLTDGENKRFSWWSTFASGGGVNAGFSTQGGFCDKDSVTSLNGITLYANAVGGGLSFRTGSKVTLWKIS